MGNVKSKGEKGRKKERKEKKKRERRRKKKRREVLEGEGRGGKRGDGSDESKREKMNESFIEERSKRVMRCFLFFVIAFITEPSKSRLFMLILIPLAAFFLPDFWLMNKAQKRQQQIALDLPDTIDLLTVSVEAGLGLDAAIQRVSDELQNVHPELSEELQISMLEAQMGIPRSEALDHLAHRTMVDEVRSMVAMINQAERFGTSIARALRNQADAIRLKRRQAAEERAQQCAVKLMLPLIFFIFPAIFIVLAGPAALSFMESGL